jgi:hypothetical protein
MNSKWLNYQLNDWDKYKKICFILNILSNCFFLFPFFITRNNFKQLFYILSFIFSNLYHNDLCNDGNSNLILYICDICSIILHLFIINNYKTILFGKYNYIIITLIYTAASCYFYALKKWTKSRPKGFHIYHSLWHIFIGISLALIELDNI